MTMFASKTPRDLNHDPFPYQSIQSAEIGLDHRVNEASLIARPEQRQAYKLDPRPEFDHVQHNEPNPILVEFRKDTALNPTIPASHLAMIWLDRDLFAFETPSAALAHAAHARRVLTRLANLSASKEN